MKPSLALCRASAKMNLPPQGSVSRAEFAAMLALIEGVDLAAYRGVSSFDDVAATATINAYRYLNNHYYDAYTYYLNGNKYIGYKEIGMSIHYLEDLNTPYHAANLTTGNSKHAAYETWAKDVAANHTTTMTYAAYRYVYDSTFIGMSNNFAGLAKGSLSVCNRFDHGNADVVAQARAATRTNLGRTERAVCGLLNRFYYNSQM